MYFNKKLINLNFKTLDESLLINTYFYKNDILKQIFNL